MPDKSKTTRTPGLEDFPDVEKEPVEAAQIVADAEKRRTQTTEPDPALPRFAPLPELCDGSRIARQLIEAGYIEAAWFVVRTKNELINARYRLVDAEEQLDQIRRIAAGRQEDAESHG